MREPKKGGAVIPVGKRIPAVWLNHRVPIQTKKTFSKALARLQKRDPAELAQFIASLALQADPTGEQAFAVIVGDELAETHAAIRKRVRALQGYEPHEYSYRHQFGADVGQRLMLIVDSIETLILPKDPRGAFEVSTRVIESEGHSHAQPATPGGPNWKGMQASLFCARFITRFTRNQRTMGMKEKSSASWVAVALATSAATAWHAAAYAESPYEQDQRQQLEQYQREHGLSPAVVQAQRWKREWQEQHPNEPVPNAGVLQKLHRQETLDNIQRGFTKMRQERDAELLRNYQLSRQHQQRILAAQHVTWTAEQWREWNRQYDEGLRAQVRSYEEGRRINADIIEMERQRRELGFSLP